MNAYKKKGVLILTPFYDPNVGGVETHLKDLACYLKEDNKYNVSVLTYQPITTKAKGAYYETHKNVTIIRIPWIGFNLFHTLEPYPILEFLYITPWLCLWTFIFLLLKGKRISVIHAQGFNASFIGRLLINIFKKRFVVSTHAVYEMNKDSLMARMAQWTLRKADTILTLSNASKMELKRIGLDENKIDTFTYWVDQEVFKPADKNEAKISVNLQGKFIVLFVGRFLKIKGITILLDAAKRTEKDICFAFAGDGPMADTIQNESKKYSNIIFIGKVENHKLPVYYNAADILCVPSEYEEGFGRVILEALSCGIPVIASNRGGIPEALDSTVGLLVEPTADNFCTAITGLFENPDTLESKKKLCRDYAVRRFGSSNAEKIVNAYNRE